MLEEVVEVLSQYTEYPADEITEETSLVDDLELNSFDVLTIVSDFEDKYNISIPDEDVINFKTVGDIEEYLETHC